MKSEPVELVIIDVPDEYVGAVTTRLGERRGQMMKMANLGFGRARIEFKVPSRGLIGFRSAFLTETRGTGLLNSLFDGWQPYGGPMLRRSNGAIVSDRTGVATPYALFHLQPRGTLLITSSTPVYEGMIIGEHNRDNDLDVNCVREKKLTNIRAAGKDENVMLVAAAHALDRHRARVHRSRRARRSHARPNPPAQARARLQQAPPPRRRQESRKGWLAPLALAAPRALRHSAAGVLAPSALRAPGPSSAGRSGRREGPTAAYA